MFEDCLNRHRGLLGHAVHDTLKHNTRARFSSGAEISKLNRAYLINGVLDFVQLEAEYRRKKKYMKIYKNHAKSSISRMKNMK